ncbi:MAG: DUF4124 domain-containing protein [Lysobacterales bacterium]
MMSSRLIVAAPVLFTKMRTLLVVVLAWLSPPLAAEEIYRCTSASGSVVFQDQKCEAGRSQVIRGSGRSGTISSRSLQQWLDRSPKKPAKTNTRPAPAPPRVSVPRPNTSAELPAIPSSEYLLSICSEKVLACTARGLKEMDSCIANAPVCSGGRSQNCCAQPFLDRYRIIRATGVVQREAVRGALLGVAGE